MKRRFFVYLLIVGILLVGLLSFNQNRPARSLLPHLPAPIAWERALVTPAGQGPEALIIAEVCDTLNIRNNFMYWAEPGDLEGFNSLILVLGFSNQGLYSMHKNAQEEMERIQDLVKEARKREIPVVLIHLGGADRRGGFNDSTARAVASGLDYIIVTRDGESDGFFTELATDHQLPITIVPDVKAVKVPLNSVYR